MPDGFTTYITHPTGRAPRVGHPKRDRSKVKAGRKAARKNR